MGHDDEDYLRGYFLWDLAQADLTSRAFTRLLAGKEPFPDARDRYSEWKQRKWVPEEQDQDKR